MTMSIQKMIISIVVILNDLSSTHRGVKDPGHRIMSLRRQQKYRDY